MKLLTYSVRDKATDLFMAPFYVRTKQEALRALKDAASNPEHAFNRHPRDYSLYALGVYDEDRGLFELNDAPVFICTLEEVMRQFELPLDLVEAAQ